MNAQHFTVPRVAKALGVTAPTIHYWVARGWIGPPTLVDRCRTPVYSLSELDEIRLWYVRHAAAGLCRGSGAEVKRREALQQLAAMVTERSAR